MLPVSTPPNAIVYGSGMGPITKMIRAGMFFDILRGLVIWVGLRVLLPLVGLAK
jgi:solute carrier family 13 (sodium-dependent dicarboxylate transporter), member 2/3/5